MTRPRRAHVLIWILWIVSLLHALTARRRAIQILLPALIVGACFRMPESRDSVLSRFSGNVTRGVVDHCTAVSIG